MRRNFLLCFQQSCGARAQLLISRSAPPATPCDDTTESRGDRAILKTKAVVQPVAVSAPIGSNSEHQSQL